MKRGSVKPGPPKPGRAKPGPPKPGRAKPEPAKPGGAKRHNARGAARRDTRSDLPGTADGAGTPLFAEIVGGLEDLATAELLGFGASELAPAPGGLRLRHDEPSSLTAKLRSVSSLYRELRFAVPRPKALLGDQAQRQLSAAMTAIAGVSDMRSFRLAAAGADSPVFQRLAGELSAATGLRYLPEDGSMLIRVRRYGRARSVRYAEGAPPASKEDRLRSRPEPGAALSAEASGWEVLLRLTERPLSTRRWRLCNRPGGVNSTVAYAMNELLGNDPRARYLNLMCGSGTLLAERAMAAGARRLVGVDVEPAAIACARTNLAAAGVSDYQLLTADVRQPLPELAGGFDELAADAPWGDAVGSHATNEELHLSLLRSAAGLAATGAGFALLSHEVKLSQRLLAELPAWRVESARRVEHGGHRPLLLLLRRV